MLDVRIDALGYDKFDIYGEAICEHKFSPLAYLCENHFVRSNQVSVVVKHVFCLLGLQWLRILHMIRGINLVKSLQRHPP